MKLILLLLTCCTISLSIFSQNLAHKIVYSHHNDTAKVNPDTIYSYGLNENTKNFITLGFRPRVSHSGRYMAFSNGPNPNSSYGANLWIRDLQTQTETQIVANSDYLDYYDFSPDDSQLVYSEECSIYTVNINGTNPYTNICSSCDCYSDDPAVRLSDSEIVFHNVNSGLYTKSYGVSAGTLVPNTVAGDLFPAWSPNGFFIGYFKTTPGKYYVTNAIYKIKPDGDSTRLLQLATTDTLAADPVWSKDLGSIYFIARIKNQLGLYNVRTNGSGDYTSILSFDNAGSVNDYWLGLSDSVSSVLSVTLVNFNGNFAGKSINLNWQTTQENNSDYFGVEKSLNGSDFNAIAKVTAHGNSNVTNNYNYYDYDLSFMNTQQNIVYYRLKEMDKDGNYNYSETIAVPVSVNKHYGVFPNPSSDGTFHFITPDINKSISVIVTNASGAPVYQNSFYNTSAGLIQLKNIKGVYLIKIKGDKNTITQKLIIQ